jgi:hypothetical protein
MHVNNSASVVDDIFSKVCAIAVDGSPTVRARAFTILGSLTGAQEKLLLQSLSKKPLLDSKKDDEHGGADTDVGKQNENVLASHAAGAFVHGLEDEFFDVRMCAIDALRQISQRSPSFCLKARDMLAEMFNDEIECVRLNAVHSLRLLHIATDLSSDLLHSISSVLLDEDFSIRSAAMRLVSQCQFPSTQLLQHLLRMLAHCIDKHGEDEPYIIHTVIALGCKHASLVYEAAEAFLHTVPFQLPPPPRPSDPDYRCALVLVAAAMRTLSLDCSATDPSASTDHFSLRLLAGVHAARLSETLLLSGRALSLSDAVLSQAAASPNDLQQSSSHVEQGSIQRVERWRLAQQAEAAGQPGCMRRLLQTAASEERHAGEGQLQCVISLCTLWLRCLDARATLQSEDGNVIPAIPPQRPWEGPGEELALELMFAYDDHSLRLREAILEGWLLLVALPCLQATTQVTAQMWQRCQVRASWGALWAGAACCAQSTAWSAFKEAVGSLNAVLLRQWIQTLQLPTLEEGDLALKPVSGQLTLQVHQQVRRHRQITLDIEGTLRYLRHPATCVLQVVLPAESALHVPLLARDWTACGPRKWRLHRRVEMEPRDFSSQVDVQVTLGRLVGKHTFVPLTASVTGQLRSTTGAPHT